MHISHGLQRVQVFAILGILATMASKKKKMHAAFIRICVTSSIACKAVLLYWNHWTCVCCWESLYVPNIALIDNPSDLDVC